MAKEIEKKFGKVVPDDAEEDTRTRARGEDELSKLNKYFETDNTRSRADQAEARRKNKKIAIEVVKALLLEKFGKGNGVKFDIEGNTLVAYLYDEGIRHAVRRATPKKLAALQKADELFANATYLYSSKNDAHGKASNNKRLDNWDYFYTPLTIEGDKTQTAGIRIAIKTYDNGDSNIYDMEMKKFSQWGPTGFACEVTRGRIWFSFYPKCSTANCTCQRERLRMFCRALVQKKRISLCAETKSARF